MSICLLEARKSGATHLSPWSISFQTMGLFTEQFLQKLGLYKRAVRPRITGFTGFFFALVVAFFDRIAGFTGFCTYCNRLQP